MVARPTSIQTSAAAAIPQWNAGIGGTPLGYEQITSTNLASAHRLNVPSGATLAIIDIEGSAAIVRWRDDGVAPTATTGMPFAVGDPPLTYSAAITVIQFITSAGTPTLNVAYYG
jgi:hypothetical protein